MLRFVLSWCATAGLMVGCTGPQPPPAEDKSVAAPAQKSKSKSKRRARRDQRHVVASTRTGPPRPPRLDLDAPMQIELGRGDQLTGLVPIIVRENGLAIVHRKQPGQEGKGANATIERTTLTLDRPARERLYQVLRDHRLTQIDGEFTQPSEYDGEEWILWLRQGKSQELAYFDGRFTDGMITFVAVLDEVLAEAGLGKAEWAPLDSEASATVDRALWGALRGQQGDPLGGI